MQGYLEIAYLQIPLCFSLELQSGAALILLLIRLASSPASVIEVLKESVNDQYDYIGWWLYEATDDFDVWEADFTLKYCLKEPEALYDYITGTLKPIPVSPDEREALRKGIRQI